MRVLLIEFLKISSEQIVSRLRLRSNEVTLTDSSEEGYELARNYPYDIILLGTDFGTFEMSGFDVLRKLRNAGVKTPVIVITGRTNVECKIRAFTLGCDDYVTTPYHCDELLCRISAVVRRAAGQAESALTVANLTVGLESRIATVNGERVHLTEKEFSVLEMLLLRKDSVVTKTALMSYLYGGRDEPEIKIVDVFVCKLRLKLEAAMGLRIIDTVWGQGYKLVDPDQVVYDGTSKLHIRTATKKPSELLLAMLSNLDVDKPYVLPDILAALPNHLRHGDAVRRVAAWLIKQKYMTKRLLYHSNRNEYRVTATGKKFLKGAMADETVTI